MRRGARAPAPRRTTRREPRSDEWRAGGAVAGRGHCPGAGDAVRGARTRRRTARLRTAALPEPPVRADPPAPRPPPPPAPRSEGGVEEVPGGRVEGERGELVPARQPQGGVARELANPLGGP